MAILTMAGVWVMDMAAGALALGGDTLTTATDGDILITDMVTHIMAITEATMVVTTRTAITTTTPADTMEEGLLPVMPEAVAAITIMETVADTVDASLTTGTTRAEALQFITTGEDLL